MYRRFLDTALWAPETGAGESPSPPDSGDPSASTSVPSGSDATADAAAGGEKTPVPSPTPPAASESETPAAAADSVQRRINTLTAEKWTERRAREAAEARANLLQQMVTDFQTKTPAPEGTVETPAAPVAKPPTVSPQELQRMAEQIASENQFQKDVQEQISKGRGSHTDFDQVAQNLQRFGDLPRHFVAAALETGNGAEIIYALGKDPAEADRILSIADPVRQAVAVAAFAQKVSPAAPAPTVSRAPAPITPKVGGTVNTSPTLEDDNLPVGDWIKLREKQLANQRQSASRR